MLEKALESPLDCKEIKPVHPKGNIHWKDWCLSGSSNTLATWYKEATHWKRPRYWERLKVGGEGDDRGWDGWMASPTRGTWVWAISRSWWWTGKPGVLQSMGSQKVGHNWASELNWTDTHRKGNKVKCLQLDNLGKKILYTIFTTFCRPEITNNKNYHDKNFKDVGCCTELGTQMFNKLYFSDVLYILSDAETSWEAI